VSAVSDLALTLTDFPRMPIQVHGVLVHAMSGTEPSRVRTEFLFRLLEIIDKSPPESRVPTLLCNHVQIRQFPVSGYPTYQDFDDNFGLSPQVKKSSLAARTQIF
jgi:hypothetical protein